MNYTKGDGNLLLKMLLKILHMNGVNFEIGGKGDVSLGFLPLPLLLMIHVLNFCKS